MESDQESMKRRAIPRFLFDGSFLHWLICVGCCEVSHQCASLCLFVWLYSGLCPELASLGGEAFPTVPGLISFPTK
jgi:hypothetical protein